MRSFYGDALPIDHDVLISGAILIDVGKLLEYDKVDASSSRARRGRSCAIPSAGWPWPIVFDLPTSVIHLIAVHSKEGDLGARTVEGWIAHHADFMTFEAFRSLG